MKNVDNALEKDILRLGQIRYLPELLDLVCAATGMGFAAVARVTENRWIAGAVKDDIQFGLIVGGELPIESTICHEIRQSHQPVIIDHVAHDTEYSNHHTPAMYGFQSYISFPVVLKDGTFFGTLCAIHPEAAIVNTPAMKNLFLILANLIAESLENVQTLSPANVAKLEMYAASELKNLRTDIGADNPSLKAAHTEKKMALLSMKINMLLMALDRTGSFLTPN
jgi:GAF domain-containing protein